MKRVKNARYPYFLKQNESLISRNTKCLFFNLWDTMTGNRDYIGLDYDDYRRRWFNQVNHRGYLIKSLGPFLEHGRVQDALDTLAQSDDFTVSSDDIYLVWKNVSETIDDICPYNVKHPLVEVERELARAHNSR
ncbi:MULTISPECIES: hypothetical protein [Vibrio]|uniref:hypothetical protein n=1 Tax=Vibrio TaxID=662 RepID=UPI0029647AAA|nr:hypothetical protein [Vibrio sp. 947]MDF5003975.1 hypothetical protein [Vibrio parahaemolyticus]MDW1926207.1 hypothetical protein [Vibrio sp. 947]HCH1702359.1 hypothetical protein [Vibrio parahaemolyticus]HCZ9540872.1 hypothetical protein [Vibrio alginolyticus]